VIALFGLVGVVGMPRLLRHVMTGPVASALDRPVRVGGIGVNPYTLTVDLDQLQIGERGTSQSFLEISHLRLNVSWASLFRLALVVQEIRVERPTMHLVRTADQRFNVSDLRDLSVPPDKSRHQFRLAVFNLQLNAGTLHIADHSGTRPGVLALQDVHVELHNLRTNGQTPASLVISAHLGGGGSVALKGRLDLTQSEVTGEVSLDQIDLPRLQDLAPSVLPARFTAGQLSAQASVQASFAAGQFNLRAEPATVSLDQVEWHVPDQQATPMTWTRLSASIAQVDWAARQVTVREMRADGVQVLVRRERDGEVNLASFIRAPAASISPNPAAGALASAWHYRIASLAIDNSEVHLEDDAAPRRVELVVAPLHLHLKDLSSDLSQPIALEFDGMLNRQGHFNATGIVVPAPLQAKLRMATHEIDLVALDAYVSDKLHATMSSAALTMDGALDLATVHGERRVSFRGDATLGDVHILDRATSESVLRWHTCSASDIEAEMGERQLKMRIGALAFTDFDARVILNSNGRLNILDMMASSGSAPASLTHTQPESGGQTPVTSSAPAPRTAWSIDADIGLGGMTLQGGHVTFTDNFIKPNYTADLTDIAGTVGAFGTHDTAPAAVTLQGQVNVSAPIAITGSVNPLAPMAFVDLKAKADGIELTGLTPYSAKYTGYPIVKGTLTIDVHYLLDQGQLTADNHLFIDQFAFGDRVESHDATTLPVRLAVALLKNARGEIAVDVPVSGSLSDPQFSLSGVILDAFVNFIVKVVTSPFRMIAAAFGTEEDLDYVEFAPGLTTLTPDSQHRLASIAQALQDRPALQLDISGRVDPQVDREGLREAKLASLIRMRKIKDLGGYEDPDRAQLTSEEYDTYLTRIYKAATFPKPRNFLGLDTSLPQAEMKKLLLTHMEITDQDLQHLADARAHAVRQWLSGQVDPGRLFVVAPTLKANDIQDTRKTTRVDLTLK
jgi:uncharacterized protein DUF748